MTQLSKSLFCSLSLCAVSTAAGALISGCTSPQSVQPIAEQNQTAQENTTPDVDSSPSEQYRSVDLVSIQVNDPDVLTGEDPVAIALGLVPPIDLEGEGNPEQTVETDYLSETEVVVTVTQTGLLDDSVKGIRSRIAFDLAEEGTDSEQWQVTSMGQQFLCYPDRGSQDWSADLCL